MLDADRPNDTALIEDKESQVDPKILEELVKAGVLYGRKKSKTHPRMQRYIYTTRNGIEIIDVVQTLSLIDKAAEFLKSVAKNKGLILFVGSTPAAKEDVKALAEKLGYPFAAERWLGGTLTNFKTIHQRLEYYFKLKADRDAGKLEKYIKKERVGFDKEIARLSTLFSGLELLNQLPQALVVVGSTSHETAVREARRLHIPIVGIISSDADPEIIDYPIPANDRAKTSINWILERLGKAIEEAKTDTNILIDTNDANKEKK